MKHNVEAVSVENEKTSSKVSKEERFAKLKKNIGKVKVKFKYNNRLVCNFINVLINGILAGVAFAIGTTAFLSINNKYMGSALFTLGLTIVFAYGFSLYTSKICYCFKNTTEQNLMLIPTWLGNIAGSMLVGALLKLTRSDISKTLVSRANKLSLEKLSESVIGILVLSVFCGILMFVATDNYKNAKNAAQKYLTLFLTVMVFILCDFEHFVSSTFMFTIGGVLNLKAFWYLLLMTLGNSIGAVIIPLIHSAVKAIRSFAVR